MIWINKHCFNSLYRVNGKGLFNVPYNNKLNGKSIDEDNLIAIAEYLQTSDVTITCADFETICKDVRSGDFVYFDSPYVPVGDTADVTDYTKAGFPLEDHERLAALFRRLDHIGAKIMLSNNDVPLVHSLYSDYNIQSLDVKRMINRNASKRTGKEVLHIIIDMSVYIQGINPYYKDNNATLFLSDAFEALEQISPACIDMIFADPPYFLSNDEITCSGGRAVSVNKGDWDKIDNLEEKHRFNRDWFRLCKRALKRNGTIWISGTLHNIYSVGMALEQEGFKIINNITWQKINPPPNLACRCFTHSTETVLWAQKNDTRARHFFNYTLMKEINGGKQLKDVWTGTLTKPVEKQYGKHPTQKPLYLLERIILASTREFDVVLDPFCGSPTTGVACKRLNRCYIGIDNNQEYIEISKERKSL